jgi:hypothetical protein
VHFLREGIEYEQPPSKQETLVEFKKAIEPEIDFTRVALNLRVLDRIVCIKANMTQEEKAKVIQFPSKNNDVFVWSTSDLVRVSREVIKHKLLANPCAKPRKQKLHKMSEEKIEAVKAEVQRLLDIGFIREVRYLQWLANVVMVHKKNGKW